jgi:chemotaxis protein MotB
MMAFFLLMWLLGSTSKGELKGIASYFSNPVKVSLMGGDGTGNSNSILPGGGRDLSKSAGQVDGGDAERAAKLMGADGARRAGPQGGRCASTRCSARSRP